MEIHFSIYFAGKAHATRCSNSNLRPLQNLQMWMQCKA